MKRQAHLFVLLSFMAILLLPSMVMAQEKFDGTKLDVLVNVETRTTPDLANINAGVVTTAATAGAALQENATKMKSVFEALKKAGVPDRDIQTAGLMVQPQYRYENNAPPEIVSYQAVNNVTVTLRKMDEIGKVFDTLIAQGANQVNGPVFDVEDRESALDKTRKEAVAKAKRRAALYAEAAGLKVKKIVSISENVGQYTPMPYQAMNMRSSEAAPAETPVSLGQVTLAMTVNVVFELE